MLMNQPITINPNVVISTTKVDPEALDRFFQGESAALMLERYRTAGVKPVQNSLYNQEKINNIDLTPAYFRRKRTEEERRKRREEYQRNKESDFDFFKNYNNSRPTPCR